MNADRLQVIDRVFREASKLPAEQRQKGPYNACFSPRGFRFVMGLC